MIEFKLPDIEIPERFSDEWEDFAEGNELVARIGICYFFILGTRDEFGCPEAVDTKDDLYPQVIFLLDLEGIPWICDDGFERPKKLPAFISNSEQALEFINCAAHWYERGLTHGAIAQRDDTRCRLLSLFESVGVEQ